MPLVGLNAYNLFKATVDLEEVRSFRCTPSRGLQAVQSPKYEVCIEPYYEHIVEHKDLCSSKK